MMRQAGKVGLDKLETEKERKFGLVIQAVNALVDR